jgi:site-specific recombinase XerD
MSTIAEIPQVSGSSAMEAWIYPAPTHAVETVDNHGYTNRELTPQETEAIRYHLSNARSKNTRLAYGTQWKLFIQWCKAQGFIPFPAEVSTVVLYLTHLSSQDHKYSKLEQALSAIKAVHSDNVHLLPQGNNALMGLSFRHPHIKAALSSIRRDMVDKGLNVVSKPRAFSQAEILAMVKACPETPAGIQDKAILLLGCNVGLRASEFCSLELNDLSIDDMGLDVRIRSSKTDQYGEGENLFVGRLAPFQRNLDAVEAMSAWLNTRASLADLDDVQSVFVAFRKGGTVLHRTEAGKGHGLTRMAITAVLQRCAERAGIESNGTNQSISSHGMRHSFITQGFVAGIDSLTLSKTTRHRSLSTLLSYDQTSRRTSTVAPKLWA